MTPNTNRDIFIEVRPSYAESRSERPYVVLRSNNLELFQKSSKPKSEEIEKYRANRSLTMIQEPLIKLSKSPSEDLLRRIGEFLFDFLPDPISELIRQEYQAAKDNSQTLRLKFVTEPLAPIDIPWELLFNNGEFLSLHPNTSIIRYNPAPNSAPALSIDPPIRLLFVLTNPKDERFMRGQEEIETIQSGISPLNYRIDILAEPTVEAFIEKLLEGQYHVVHYIGHGGVGRGEGNLILHDYESKSYWLSSEELGRILPPTVKLLCLSTCFTAENYQIQAFNRLGGTWGRYDLPTMVVNQFPLSKTSVHDFWNEFYLELNNTGKVDTAVNRGRIKVGLSQSPDWASFVLHLRGLSETLFTVNRISEERSIAIADDPGISKLATDVKAIEAQLDSITSILNDLKYESNVFDEPPEGLEKAIKQTEYHHSNLLDKYFDLKRSLDQRKFGDGSNGRN